MRLPLDFVADRNPFQSDQQEEIHCLDMGQHFETGFNWFALRSGDSGVGPIFSSEEKCRISGGSCWSGFCKFDHQIGNLSVGDSVRARG